MQSQGFLDYINNITIGSTQSAITIKSLGFCPVLLPDKKTLLKFYKLSEQIKHYYDLVVKDKLYLTNLETILLVKASQAKI